jgi:hypothetical protein
MSTNQSSYLPGQTVAIAVTMLYGTTPDAGASLSVTVMAPNGKTTTLSGTTGSNGVASLNYTLSNSATAGTYQIAQRPKWALNLRQEILFGNRLPINRGKRCRAFRRWCALGRHRNRGLS